MSPEPQGGGGPGWRAVGIALAGVPVVCMLTVWGDLVVGGAPWGSGFPPMGPTLLLLLLAGASALVARRRPGARLRADELLLLFAVWSVAAGVPGRGLAMLLLPNLTGHLYYERAARALLFGDRIPPGWAPGRPEAVRALYEGSAGGVAWEAWAAPLLIASALALCLWLVPMGLALLLGPAWVREERVSYPAAQIPLALTGADGLPGERPLWRRLPFAVALLVPILLRGINLVHAVNPMLPGIPLTDVSLDAVIAERPWSALRPLRADLYPAVVGVLYLAPADLLGSFSVFWLVGRTVALLGAIEGLAPPGAPAGAAVFPYTAAQGAGATAVFALWLLWRGRRALGGSLRVAVTGAGEAPARDRCGWLLLLAGLLGIVFWARAAGWSAGIAVPFFALLLAGMLVLSRLVAEAGFLWPPGPAAPEGTLLALLGTARREPSDLALLALQSYQARDPRGWIAPHFFQGQRLLGEGLKGRGEERPAFPSPLPLSPSDLPPRFSLSGLAALWIAALLIALAVALPGLVGALTDRGALTLGGAGRWAFTHFANEPFVRLAAWLREPSEPSLAAAAATAVGGLVTLALAIARAHLTWWPFHPLGYIVSVSPDQLLYAQVAPSFFLAWLLKAVTLRWGGLTLYRALRPAAVALVIGDFAMAAVGTLFTAFTGISAPPTWPG
jgi:hypothetical protein